MSQILCSLVRFFSEKFYYPNFNCLLCKSKEESNLLLIKNLKLCLKFQKE